MIIIIMSYAPMSSRYVCQVSLIFIFAYSHIQKYGKPNAANDDKWPLIK